MILDHINNLSKYNFIHDDVEKVVDFLAKNSLNSLEVGKFDIANGAVAMSVSEKSGSSMQNAKFEAHDFHIDIQICIDGNETIGWKYRKDCYSIKDVYNQEKDVTFYNDIPDTYFQLQKNQFAIFFPTDVHAPMIGEQTIKKLVCKLKC